MSTQTIACPHCHLETTADRVFCEHCDELLPRLEAVGVALPSVWEDEPDAHGLDEEGAGDASLSIEPADPDAIGRRGVPTVEAGQTVAFIATIRNESRIVDNYELVVAEDSWAMISPSSVFLTPMSSAGESQTQVRIDVTPPRLHTSTADVWSLEVHALSQARNRVAAVATLQFEILPFTQIATEAAPLIRTRRLKARYRVTVRNDGNAPAELWLVATPEEERLRARFRTGHLTLGPGDVDADVLTLRPPYPLPTGRRIEHRATVDAVPAGTLEQAATDQGEKKGVLERLQESGAAVTVSQQGVRFRRPRLPRRPRFRTSFTLDAGTLARARAKQAASREATVSGQPVVFRQKPIVPIWLLLLLLLAAGATYVILQLLPDRATVPRLAGSVTDGKDTFSAQRALRAAGLKLAEPVQTRSVPDMNVPRGSVVDQLPSAGTKLEKGKSVVIVVATGPSTVPVPRLTGLTRDEADKVLRDGRLTLGQAEPADAPARFIVRSQVPAPMQAVATGTPVQVFLKAPPVKKKKAKKDDKDKDKNKQSDAGGDKGKPKPVVIPAIGGQSGDEYAAALRKLKLKPVEQRQIAGVAAGKVLLVKPSPGTKAKTGDQVLVRSSSGSPNIAVETQGLVQIVNPLTSRPIGQLPMGDGSAVEPTFTPDGMAVLYRSGTQLQLARVGSKRKARTLLSASDHLVLPSFASDGKTVAVLRQIEGDGDLCFGRTLGRALGQRCLPDDGWNLFGRPAWRPDGKLVLVPARNAEDPTRIGLRAYSSRKAFSTDPSDWHGRTSTDTSSPNKGVIAVAFSRDGVRLAAVSNLETPDFEVVTSSGKDVELVDAFPTSVPACDVAWRPDGRELTVVQVDKGCTSPLGTVVRFLLSKTKRRTQVAKRGQHPVYVPRG